MVTFVDEPQQVYGAVLYLQRRYKDGLATALKTNVALLTPMTILRLELIDVIYYGGSKEEGRLLALCCLPHWQTKILQSHAPEKSARQSLPSLVHMYMYIVK